MLDHRTAQSLGNDLMTETDADHRHGGVIGVADEPFQNGDEVVFLVCTMA